ncbi:MAG: ABC transporter permease [Chloroflexota bacterium]
MTRYLIRRVLQAIPVLLFISVAVYGLIIVSPVDPLSIYEENPNITPEDMAMLEYRLGLRQPAFLNFRGSNGTVVAEKVELYNKAEASGGIEAKKTGELTRGTRVAVVDATNTQAGEAWVKVLWVEDRITGWTERANLSIRVNPFDSRYFRWLFAVLQGDLGRSNVERRPALDIILERFPATFYLMSVSFIGQLLIALPVGIISAIKQYSIFDHLFTILAYAGRSIPIFWFGLLLIIIFHSTLDWPTWFGESLAGKPLFPGGGMYDTRLRLELGYAPWWDYLYHLILPVAMLSVFGAASYMRYMRASMLEVIHQDYIRTARAKGLKERVILYSHALKNAAIPIVTIVALDLPILFGGALFTETIFSWPGMGKLFFRSAQRVDYSVLMGIVMINATLIVTFNLLADLVYAFLDPRIRYE